MRLLLFSQYFTPEIGAGPTRVHTFAAGLAARGHDVEVVCEVPNHPEGLIHPGYGAQLVDRRRVDGFDVTYVRVLTARVKTRVTRLAFYGSYVAMAGGLGLASRRPDAVFASSPPLPVGLPAALAARRHGSPFVFDVRDLWPEAAVAMGELPEGRLADGVDAVARWLYREASAITTVTEPFRAAIGAKADMRKVHLLPNGTTSLWLHSAELAVKRAQVGLPAERFVWAYAGNLSAAQRLRSAVEAAGLLGPEFQLLVVGEGPERRELEDLAATLPEGCVSFRGLLPPEGTMRLLRASDVLLVQLAPEPALRDFVPSKLYDYCAVGRPVIVAAAGEATRLASQANAALPVAPGDPKALAHAVRRLRADEALRGNLSAAGRAFAADNVRERQVERLDALIGELVSARR